MIARDHNDRALHGTNDQVQPRPARFPLPPEGQRPDDLSSGQSVSNDYERKLRGEDAKYWEEGWYLWYSQNRWAAQERIDLMMADLPSQSNWYSHMAKQRADWEQNERKGKWNLEAVEVDPPTMAIAPPKRSFPDPS